jgi:hypothetical protein
MVRAGVVKNQPAKKAKITKAKITQQFCIENLNNSNHDLPSRFKPRASPLKMR